MIKIIYGLSGALLTFLVFDFIKMPPYLTGYFTATTYWLITLLRIKQ